MQHTMKRCKKIMADGEQCPRPAMLSGYCIRHYTQELYNEKKENK